MILSINTLGISKVSLKTHSIMTVKYNDIKEKDLV